MKRIGKAALTPESFARKYKLQTKKDAFDNLYVPGKLGQLFVYDEDEGLIGAMFIPDQAQKGWAQRRQKLTEAGARVIQNGDTEGTVAFSWTDAAIVRLAAKLMGVQLRRPKGAATRRASGAANVAPTGLGSGKAR